jgi:AcrR family transcriptional regulator
MSDGKRAYDARRRRERAEQERTATRRRVLDAATRLFVANGYTATTMADIAREAGVALQSVYKAGQSKAELLRVVVDVAIAGDGDEVMLADRPAFTAISDESDPRRQVQRFADLIALIQERAAPLQAAYRQAAAVDDTVRANLAADHRRRLATYTTVIGMVPREHLRRPVKESAETAWALGSPETFLLLRDQLGWDGSRYRRWLRATLVAALLTDSTTVESPEETH